MLMWVMPIWACYMHIYRIRLLKIVLCMHLCTQVVAHVELLEAIKMHLDRLLHRSAASATDHLVLVIAMMVSVEAPGSHAYTRTTLQHLCGCTENLDGPYTHTVYIKTHISSLCSSSSHKLPAYINACMAS